MNRIKDTLKAMTALFEKAAAKLPLEDSERFTLLRRLLLIEIHSKRKDDLKEHLHTMEERDRYKTMAEETAHQLVLTAELLQQQHKETLRLEAKLQDAERLLKECSQEYNNLLGELSTLKTVIGSGCYEEDEEDTHAFNGCYCSQH